MAIQRRKVLAQALNLGYGTDTIPSDSGGTLVGDKIGIHTFIGTPYISARDFPGTNFGEQVNAAIGVATVGTVIDARSFAAANFSTTITLNKAVNLILPKATMTFTGTGRAFDITANNASISGQGFDSVLKMGAAVPLIRVNNVSNWHLRDFMLDGASRAFASNGIQIGSSSGITNLGQMERLYFQSIQGSAINLAATEEFDDWELLFSIISDCGTASLPALNLAGLVDTARLVDNQWEGFLSTGILGGANVQRVRVFGDKFHGDTPTNTNIAIDWTGYRSQFIGCQFNYIQGTDQVLVKNVDNSFIGCEHTDGGAATNTYNLSSSANRIRIIGNEITGAVNSSLSSVPHTGTHVLLASVTDCIVADNIIRNASASPSSKSIAETGTANRNDVHNNITINAGTVETIVGSSSLFSNNGAPGAYVTRGQKFATGDAGTPSLDGDMRVKRAGSSLGDVEFDDGTTKIVGYGSAGVPANTIEMYVSNALKVTVDGTQVKIAPPLVLASAAKSVAAAQVSIGSTTAATATNGTGEAMKANVEGYLIINVAGTNVKVPYVKN